ncbi:NUDIX hydrolase [Desulfolithobacter dissulfuricans]|uniref:NUDIX hydrolase n=1 Tax=Desulfolithobacter dissulfuricans TaxID=2795293 RepID=A0A915U028_9BACT|nr:NUDIX hydrolase YfcD [Desulfolithobacter dissulfuricans]BCO07967.1 NUDIX hydrolase [Desulfolithobacter dissulfuricans]
MYPTAMETVQIVDEENREIAAVPRHIMREQNLIHRASYILVFNREGQLFVQKRTMDKDVYPGYFDIAAGGVVLAGESYEEAAKRELAEELGVSGVKLNVLFDQYYEDRDNRVWGRIFSCRHEGPFVLQKEEVAWGRFMDLAEILALGNREPVTPDGLEVLKRLQETPALLSKIKKG